jgi:hypothetical protein
LTASGKETVLHNFDNLNFPYGGVLRVGNELYGTTSGGVVDFAGTVFSLSI